MTARKKKHDDNEQLFIECYAFFHLKDVAHLPIDNSDTKKNTKPLSFQQYILEVIRSEFPL